MLLSNVNFLSFAQKYADVLRDQTTQREEHILGLEQVQTRFSNLVGEIEKNNQESAELLEKLRSIKKSDDHAKTELPVEKNDLGILAKLVQFVIDLKHTESLEKLYPKISDLKTQARAVEAEAIKLDTEIKSLKEITAQARLLLSQKKATTNVVRESRSIMADVSSKL